MDLLSIAVHQKKTETNPEITAREVEEFTTGTCKLIESY